MNRVVGLTGGVGSGKSTALKFFRRFGCETADADEIVHRALRPKGAAYHRVARLFGPMVKKSDGSLDRAGIADLVFRRPPLRRRLERILHPLVIKEFRRRTRQRRAPLVLDIPLLYETRLENLVDEVAVVWAPLSRRLARLRQRGVSRGDALRRIQVQMPLEEKRRRASVVLDNSGPLARLRAQVRAFCGRLKQIA